MVSICQRSVKLLSILLLVLGGVVFSGCESIEYRPSAVGREGEIVVVMDSTNWEGELGDAVREHVAPYLGTLPAPEREFEIRRISINSQKTLESLQKQKNVIFVAPLSEDTPEARFLRSRLDEEATAAIKGGGTSVISKRDLWRKDQQIVYLLGETDSSLVALLAERGDDIRYTFNVITRERVGEDMFKKGRQPKIEVYLPGSSVFSSSSSIFI